MGKLASFMLYKRQKLSEKRNLFKNLEDVMTENTQTTTRKNANVGTETSDFALGVGMALAAMIGIWGMVCLVSAFMTVGPLDLVKGYFTALFG